jgi:hypothetical protein
MTIKLRMIHWIRHNLHFFFFGLLCIVWFLLRTGTKPTRINYPCQKASVFGANLWIALYLLPLVSLVKSKGNGLKQYARLFGAVIIAIALIICAVYLFEYLNSEFIPESTAQSSVVLGITERRAVTNEASDIFVVNGTLGNDGGVFQLLNLMERKGTPFYAVGNTKDKAGLIAKDDVVILKVNSQWDQRGGTNTDLIKSLIQEIVDHPDGFIGEIIIADNGQAQYGVTGTGGNLDYARNNAENRSQSIQRVAESFSGIHRISTYLWDTITTKRVNEYSEGDMNDGYIINETPNPRTDILVSYPKFRTQYGTCISFKNGIWDTGTQTYDEDRLKIINLPVLKTHGEYGVTGSVKNYMGVASDKLTALLGSRTHSTIGKGGMGTEMVETRFPSITILDAIWINAQPEKGPRTPDNRATRTNVIAASTDPVALDFWAAQNILIPAAKSQGYSDLSSMDPKNNFPGKFGYWLRLSMMELRNSGYQTTIDTDSINVFCVQNPA